MAVLKRGAWARFRLWLWLVLLTIDQFWQVVLAGPKFISLGGGEPSPDETISSRVGRAAIEGRRWALICERLIDGVFGHGHCRANIGR